MAIAHIVTTATPQIIPTNAGLRTFARAAPGAAGHIVPNDLFYIRNHWKDCPKSISTPPAQGGR